MRRILLALALAGTGCITGGAQAPRDERLLRELSRQERWTQQALEARPNRGQLDAIRGSDYGSVAAARKELQKLVMSIDRGTWIRETTAEMMREDRDPQLPQTFDRAGRMRIQSIQAADELADALAEARGGLTVSDLGPAFDALRKAQASEDRLARAPGLKLVPSPVPVPRPFVEAAAMLVVANPEMAKELDRLPSDEQIKIRAKMADVDREREEQKRVAIENPQPTPTPGPSAPVATEPPPPREAEAPSTTLKISGDAASILARRPPKSITLREDGLFALTYDDGVYLVDPDGKLVRKEATNQ